MPPNLPDLLDGKPLTGVLPIEKQPPSENLLPLHSQPLLDIESCIDDPSLAPLGTHVTTLKKKRHFGEKAIMKNEGQVQIRKGRARPDLSTVGTLMLRRRNLDAEQLAKELEILFIAPLTPFLKLRSGYRDLVELDLSRNNLTKLPKQITRLANLQSINLSANQFSLIPTEIYSLKLLHILNLSQNILEIIPDEMPKNLPNLEILRLAANKIHTLPSRMDTWIHMRQLQLGSVFGGNRLARLPDNIADMPALEELDVSHNMLRALPPHLGNKTLIILNASSNQIDFIPKAITRCSKLKQLNVSKNHLTTLPADLVGLRQLELLDISENLLCIMPAEVLERMQFTTLLITGNPLTRPGNCDQQQSSQNAYAKILRQMTQRGIARSSPVTSPLPVKKQVDVCGPNGMGCLSVSDSYFAPVSTASFSSCTEIPSSSHDFPSTDSTSYSSSYSSTSTASSAYSAFSTYSSSATASDSSTVEPINTKPLHPTTTFNIEDEDATIDRELSYHAQQLNIDGSRPSTPTILSENRLTGTAKSPLSPSHQSSESYIVDNVDSIPPTARLFHSLCEIATRTLLKSNIEIPKNYLPLHLEQDVLSGKKCRSCAQCQGPFVNEWITSVQIKSSGSHPGVVRRVRFCSTECWKECLSLDGNGKTEVSLHKVTSS